MIRAVVTDGITIGRPCCGVHNCSETLLSPKERFCQSHSEYDTCCAVVTCRVKLKAEDGKFLTCKLREHRALEDHFRETASAQFQLKTRLEKARVAQVERSIIDG